MTPRNLSTDNEKLGRVEHRRHALDDLDSCDDKLLPAELPHLLRQIVEGPLPETPLVLTG